MVRVQPVGELEHGLDELAKRDIGRAVLQDLDMDETLSTLQQHIKELTFGISISRLKSCPCDYNTTL